MITFDLIRNNPEIRTYIAAADSTLEAIGYTEHSFAHATLVAEHAAYILSTLGYPERTVELARIAGFLHDIGNMVNRVAHSQSGALMAFSLLTRMGMDAEETSAIVSAIGNHDEGTGEAVSPLAAALIIADKTDVRRSRVRSETTMSTDIHDRVNYSVKAAKVTVDREARTVTLSLRVDTDISQVMDYFEIFLERMIMCRKAAAHLDTVFCFLINGQRML